MPCLKNILCIWMQSPEETFGKLPPLTDTLDLQSGETIEDFVRGKLVTVWFEKHEKEKFEKLFCILSEKNYVKKFETENFICMDIKRLK